MHIELTKFFNEDGVSRSFNGNLNMKEVEVDGVKPFVSPVIYSGKITSHAGAVELEATIEYDFCMPCNRCAEDYTSKTSLKIRHLLARELNDEDNDVYILVEDTLDLDELLYSDVILELPIKYICKDDCRGICPECGKNLNIDDCNCKKSDIDPRLEALRSLLD